MYIPYTVGKRRGDLVYESFLSKPKDKKRELRISEGEGRPLLSMRKIDPTKLFLYHMAMKNKVKFQKNRLYSTVLTKGSRKMHFKSN